MEHIKNNCSYKSIFFSNASDVTAKHIATLLGHSLGSYIAEQFAVTYPEKVERLILASSACGGEEGIPKPPQFLKLHSDVVNKSKTITQEEINALLSASYGSGWLRLQNTDR